ncbi:gastrula zinc finger protein XlCGF8.2DB-like [Leguminivora glycinivorella]|uniref:gastrula zinc finger protein XlCGF8.2DB-like n=1 Tax=Leguminivora glycinivorella TaxID=1035111 RepID=UPI0020105241|nr:gastrula zinc finger protein XlCGF8.2DB-like [Leguminivora glycinivorella]
METSAESGSMSPARVKLEPETDQSEMAPVKEEAVFLDEAVFVKEDWLDSTAGLGVGEGAMLADLYTKHEVKDELVLGPERPHRPVVVPAALCNRVAASALVSAEPTPSAIAPIYQCHHCGRRFSNMSSLKEHVLSQSPLPHTTTEGYDGIERQQTTKPNLTTTRVQHTDYKNNFKTTLQTHLMTNSGDKPFSCTHCDYKCRSKAQLTSHLRIHTDEKPFSCSYCDFNCKRKADLQTHLMTHTGENPFSCSHCDYKCKRISHLKSHLMIHTGEKPFSCSHCDYKCRREADFKSHLMTHIKEEPL